MKKDLRVLIIEDSEDDTYFLVRELEAAGFAPEHERVTNAAAFTEALDSKNWDVILCDHSMPTFGSLDALKILRQSARDIPFIVVSGTIGEDVAVNMMKAGASDYVMKGTLARLAPAIEREMRESENRRAHHAAEESLAYLAAIVESSDDAIIGKTLDGTILTWNSGAERMYGYTAEEMKGRSISILVPPYRPEELPQIYERLTRGERIERYETVRIRKDGEAIDVALTLSPIKDRAGRVVGVSAIERDISARAQEERERLKLIEELTDALAKIKTLRGLLPICASCKRIRDDHGYWQKVELYISEHTDAEFTHGICPECVTRLYPGLSTGKLT